MKNTFLMLLRTIRPRLGAIRLNLKYFIYKIAIPVKVWKIRRKDKIRVLFVVAEVSMWKTENLYRAMLDHPRFEPLLLPASNIAKPDSSKEVEEYLRKKGYKYKLLSEKESIQDTIRPDIIFYQQPYSGWHSERKFEASNNRKPLICHVDYCFRIMMDKYMINNYINLHAWKLFSENEMTTKEMTSYMNNKGKNVICTGLPVMDELILDKAHFPDRWKKMPKAMKRIIYAPHHSITSSEPLSWGTILEYADFMMSMAEKYKEQVQWIFKPHPFLYHKLCKIWGEHKTRDYDQWWKCMPNCQMIDDPYIDVFKHSDAMIHDCGSYMIEYHYTGNPVMYIYSSRVQNVQISRFARESLKLHYSAHCCEDIEAFILNIISGNDPLVKNRDLFKQRNLIPNGASACENIIASILNS